MARILAASACLTCAILSWQGFWRNWHASFNLWLVRYLYVPLGGGAWRAANVWPIFTFVALWHDLEWRLLAWAWLSSLLFAPELVRRRYMTSCCAVPLMVQQVSKAAGMADPTTFGTSARCGS